MKVEYYEGMERRGQNGCWRFPVYKNGKRAGWFNTEKTGKTEALRVKKAEQGKEEGPELATTESKVTLEDYFPTFLADATNLAEGTKGNYKRDFRLHMRPVYKIRVSKFEVSDVKRLLRVLRTKTKPGTEELYSGDAQLNVFRALSSCLSTAVEDGILKVNPCTQLKSGNGGSRPQGSKRKVPTLGRIHLELLLEAAGEYRRDGTVFWQALLAVLFFLGPRRHEVAELQWKNVDFKKNQLEIERGKTVNAARWVKMPQELRQLLLVHRDETPYMAREDYVFSTSRRQGINIYNVNRMVRRARQIAIELADERFEGKELETLTAELQTVVPHGMRHNWASAQIASGIDPTTLALTGGWANGNVPLAIYSHEFKERQTDQRVADVMDELYGGVGGDVVGLRDAREGLQGR